MAELIVASQWNAKFSETVQQALRVAFPDARVVPVEGWQIPPDASILLANATHKDVEKTPRPAGWPFNLSFIQLISSGTDVYPRWMFQGNGKALSVASAKGTSAIPMAEFALAVIFAQAKRLPELWIQRAEDWRLTNLGNVSGTTLGLVGLGALGLEVARRALAVGMHVVALRRSDRASPLPGVALVKSIDELMAKSDHLVLLAPATPETRHMINARTLALAKPGLHLINLARGTLVDQQALIEALDAGKLARATLDVTEPEPLPTGHALYKHPKVKISAHTSVVSPLVYTEIVSKTVRNISAWASGSPLEDEVGNSSPAADTP